MNDIVIANAVVIPVLWRNGVSGAANALQGMDLTGLGLHVLAATLLVQAVRDRPEPGGELDSFAGEAV